MRNRAASDYSEASARLCRWGQVRAALQRVPCSGGGLANKLPIRRDSLCHNFEEPPDDKPINEAFAESLIGRVRTMDIRDSDGLEPAESELLRGDPTLAGLLAQFLERLPDRLGALEQALHAADFESLRQAAHQLKGSGGGYGFPQITKLAAAVERHARCEALDECADALANLRRICEQVIAESD